MDDITRIEDDDQALKKVIRLTYKMMLWLSTCLLIPTIGTYFLNYEIIKYARDTGIIITTIALYIINKKMNKKQKTEVQ